MRPRLGRDVSLFAKGGKCVMMCEGLENKMCRCIQTLRKCDVSESKNCAQRLGKCV